jgi:hypothetical protein
MRDERRNENERGNSDDERRETDRGDDAAARARTFWSAEPRVRSHLVDALVRDVIEARKTRS